MEHENCAKEVQKGWGEDFWNDDFCDRVKNCGSHLNLWGFDTFGNVSRKIREIKDRLKILQTAFQSETNIREQKNLETQLEELLKLEEIKWYQRAKTFWIKDGDRNTSFFHRKASQRKERNTIEKLKKKNGDWTTNDKDVNGVLKEFFMDLFTTEGPADTRRITDLIEPRVTGDMNDMLTKPYTVNEIKKALKQMHPTKSPGPDGMPPLFFQSFWNIVGTSFVSTCLHILNNDGDPTPLNHTFIVLIPKTKRPTKPSEFRPISLCNVICRVISKVIANRLKSLLNLVISPNQSAFIPNRLITDNAMIAFETFHYMRKKKTGKKGFLALKLDMSKAYDRVEWIFLEKMCRKLGFCEKWINLVMKCVTTVSYSILVNGKKTESFTPSRGLRQGDPISPYLFLICAEGFSTLINKAEQEGNLTGIRIARTAPQVSHLFFADDSVLFFRATQAELDKVKEIIASYEAASGQRVNLVKSELLASANIPDAIRDEMGQQLGARTVGSYTKYLGLPTLIGRSKREVFQITYERVLSKLKGWKETTLSKAGREILIKSVIQAIPTFAMSCFLLPKSLCEDIEKATARFYWGAAEGERKIHWASLGQNFSLKRGGWPGIPRNVLL